MRQKVRKRHGAVRPLRVSTLLDVGGTARRLALFEAGNGWQHGVIEILVALLAASMLVPLRPFRRS